MQTASLTASSVQTPLRTSRSTGARLGRILREPLLHFALLGALIFVVAHRIEASRDQERSHIVIDRALVERIANLQVTQSGVRPSQTQLAALVDSYIDDEVLFREAHRLGLEQDDEIVRRRLIQKLEFLQQGVAVTTPNEADLRAYFDAHRGYFERPARVSFRHLYFSADRDGDTAAQDRALQAHDRITAGGIPQSDVFPLDDALADLDYSEAARLFGASAFVDALFKAPAGAWSQPVRSGFGWHLIYVTQRTEPRSDDYDALKDEVRAAYLRDAAASAKRRSLDVLRERYRVVREADTGGLTP
jgi:peptidyl-prolyl cis-trans isomerase C